LIRLDSAASNDVAITLDEFWGMGDEELPYLALEAQGGESEKDLPFNVLLAERYAVSEKKHRRFWSMTYSGRLRAFDVDYNSVLIYVRDSESCVFS